MKSNLHNFLVILSTAILSINYSFAGNENLDPYNFKPKSKPNVTSHYDHPSSTTEKLFHIYHENNYNFYRNPTDLKKFNKAGKGKNNSEPFTTTMKTKF